MIEEPLVQDLGNFQRLNIFFRLVALPAAEDPR
jgi:hypothetical protein